VIGWANPKLLEPSSRPAVQLDLVLHDLGKALAIVAAYFVFVGMSILFLRPADGESNGEKSSKLNGRSKTSVVENFKAGPILFVSKVTYNALQVVLCGWMVVASMREYRTRGFVPICNEFSTEIKVCGGLLSILHVFYVSKVLDFMDTVFIVAGGKWRQLSFLHVYHHSTIFIVYWLSLNVGYDGDIYLTVVLNGFIHFLMYFYYLATTFNISVPSPLKKLLTNSQLVQFVVMMSQATYLLLHDCPFPRRVTTFYLLYIFSLFVLFMAFRLSADNYGGSVKKAKKQ